MMRSENATTNWQATYDRYWRALPVQRPWSPGERVLYFKPVVWAASGKSLPSYRFSLRLPLIQEMGLYITDRRVVLSCWLLRLVRFEWTAWFGSRDWNADQDEIKEVSVGRNPVLGRYLQLVTYGPVKHWWRSRKARVRIFMKDPESVCRLVTEALRTFP